MTIYFEQRDSSIYQGAGTPAITAFIGNRITFSSNLAWPAGNPEGTVLWVFGSISNDGPYTVVARNALNDVTVSPTPNAEAAQGNGRVHQKATIKQAWTAVTTFNAGQIVAAGANFLAYPCHAGDRVCVRLSTSNDGAYFVTSVASATTLNVQPLNGEPNVIAEAVPGGCQVEVRQGNHVLRIIGQASSNWADVFTNAVARPQTAPATSSFGAGVIGDYLSRTLWGESQLDLWQTIGLGHIYLEPTAGCVFGSQNELVVSLDSGPGDTTRRSVIQAGSGAQYLEIGSDGGGNENAAQDGSLWAGWTVGFGCDTRIYHSYIWPAASIQPDVKSQIVGSVIRPGMYYGLGSAGPHRIDSITIGPGGIASGSAGLDAENLHLAKQTATLSIYNFGAAVVIYLEGLLASDLIPVGGLFLIYGLTLNVLNPREDYSIATLFGSVFPNAIGARLYTFNPRFVERDSVGNDPVPIPGLVVKLYYDYGLGPLPLGSWTTAASGRLEGIESDRDGINLTRGINYQGTALDNWKHTITVEGAGRRFVNQTFEMTSRQQFDFPVDALATDFEGEIST